MDKYTLEAIGKIVIIRNIIFKNTQSHKKETDPAWETGRPCVIIHSDDEYDYFLTMSSNPNLKKYEQHYVPINNTNLLPIAIRRHNVHKSHQINKKGIRGAINLENIYRVPISGHDEIGKLTFDTFKSVIERLKQYHNITDLNEIEKKTQTIRGAK